MIITGIIAEYNPFHNGHLFHLRKTREKTNPDLVIAIMSGNFVQRGEPAIFDKWTRTKLALINGVDIVIELPTIYATSSSENFANGSILALKAIKANNFVFGSESNNISNLREIAEISHSESSQFKKVLRKYLNQGLSYPQAYQETFNELHPELVNELNKSNNILGISYLEALLTKNLDIKAYSVKRIGNDYHDTTLKGIASATAIRKKIEDYDNIKNTIPSKAARVLKNHINKGYYLNLNDFSNTFFCLLKRATYGQLERLPEIEIGMVELLKNQAYSHKAISDFIDGCTSRRYTTSRIQRLLIRLLLNIDKNLYHSSLGQKDLPYIRILGMNVSKSKMIKQWQESLDVPIIQKTSIFNPENNFSKLSWELDLRATDIYFDQHKNEKLKLSRQDFTHPIVVIKKS
ncbi:MAG: nucleotidyltransferase [Clostridia bacterium]